MGSAGLKSTRGPKVENLLKMSLARLTVTRSLSPATVMARDEDPMEPIQLPQELPEVTTTGISFATRALMIPEIASVPSA